MATQRKSASSRPKAKKAARPAAKASKGAAAKARPARSAPAKTAPRAAAKPAPKIAAKPAAKVAPKVVPSSGNRFASKFPPKGASKFGGKFVAKPAPVAGKGVVGKPAVKGGPKLKVKGAPRPPAVVHPIGVLPPESISRLTHKPAKPLPIPPRVVPKKPPKNAPIDPGAQPVTKKDFQEFEGRLLEERTRVLKEMGHYENTVLKVNQRDSAGDLSGYSFHMADVGTDAMEREKAFQLASAEGRILLEINEALRRMARGEYGTCESCSNPILRARLEAMPTARLCLSCKEKEERAQRGIL